MSRLEHPEIVLLVLFSIAILSGGVASGEPAEEGIDEGVADEGIAEEGSTVERIAHDEDVFPDGITGGILTNKEPIDKSFVGGESVTDEGSGIEEETPSPFIDALTIIEQGVPVSDEPFEDREAFFDALDEGVRLARDSDTLNAIESLIMTAGGGYVSAAPYYNIAMLAEFDEEGARYKGDNLNYGLALYHQTLAYDPDYSDASYNLAVLYQKLEFPEEAEAIYRELLEEGNEVETRARYNLALILREKKRLGEAIEIIEDGDEPYEKPQTLLLLALLGEENGAYSRSIRLYKKALDLDLSPEMRSLAVRKISILRELHY